MSKSNRVFIGIVALLVAFVVAGRLGWLPRLRSPATTDSADSSAVPSAPFPQATTAEAPAAPPGMSSSVPSPAVAEATSPPAEVASDDPGMWEQQVDEILTSDDDTTVKAQKLTELYPKLPEDGQIEAAQHMANLLPDDQFVTSAGPLITNALTPQAVIDVLIGDMLNRPNQLKLPLLLEVAKTPTHPWKDEAKVMLELYVEQDLGDNWGEWEKAVQTWLKENSEEEK
jgi:hypothetical protein